jgi:hypothetical protein
MKKVVNTKNKTGPGRSPFELHLPLIREMLDSGASQLEICVALSKLGDERTPNSLSATYIAKLNGPWKIQHSKFYGSPFPSGGLNFWKPVLQVPRSRLRT